MPVYNERATLADLGRQHSRVRVFFQLKNMGKGEVGISHCGRTCEEGKKIGWKDGIRAFYRSLKYSLKRRKPKLL
jgi:hypothetical protein